MNASNIIFQLLCIHIPPKSIVLTPSFSLYTFCCANTSDDYVNTYANYIDISIDYANKFAYYAHTSNDCTNRYVDLANAFDTPTSNFCIPNSSFL